jgi:3-hydroxyacyl-CoA dehydrogenase
VTPHVLLAGTGKMALDLAGFFVAEGFAVTLRARSDARAAMVGRALDRIARRHEDGAAPPRLRCIGPAAALPDASLVVETTREDLLEKRRVLGELSAAYDESVPLVSNSSSLLPSDLHPRCMGLHFFYPAFLTRVVEWTVPEGAPAGPRSALARLLPSLGLHVIQQSERGAFAINRLLLGAQARCARAVLDGAAPAGIDEACVAAGFSRGLLSMMDAIGLDIVLAAVRSYAGRASLAATPDLSALTTLLAGLVHEGRLGDKAQAGLLRGSPGAGGRATPDAQLAVELRAIFRDSCRSFIAAGELTAADLEIVTRKVFGRDWGI